MAAFRAIDWVLLEHAARRVKVGDLLSVDAGGMPIFQVTAIADDVISLRDERHPPVQVRSLAAFNWMAAAV